MRDLQKKQGDGCLLRGTSAAAGKICDCSWLEYSVRKHIVGNARRYIVKIFLRHVKQEESQGVQWATDVLLTHAKEPIACNIVGQVDKRNSPLVLSGKGGSVMVHYDFVQGVRQVPCIRDPCPDISMGKSQYACFSFEQVFTLPCGFC